MQFRAITWNLFHGRDFPPDPRLRTWRSRLLRLSERNATHLQVNRDLFDEFAAVLASAAWDVALLQECPPRWHRGLAVVCDASAQASLTSRNSLAPLRHLAARLNPDLIASNEGGSNLTLLRRRSGRIIERRELELQRGPRPERRTMAFSRIRAVAHPAAAAEVCVANLHASAGSARRTAAEAELLLAATRACEWAGELPLILGGDLNLRPAGSGIFAELEREFGLGGATAPQSLDHLLARGLEPVVGPSAWPPERREVRVGTHAVRLSDHAPIEAEFRLSSQTSR